MWKIIGDGNDMLLENKNFKTDWQYKDIKWRCIPGVDVCNNLEVDRDGSYDF